MDLATPVTHPGELSADPHDVDRGPADGADSRRFRDRGPRLATRRGNALEAGIAVGLVAVALLWGLSGGAYRLQVATNVALFVALAYSFNVISGFTGYLSFGQVTFYGIGGFTMAGLLIHSPVPWYWAAPLCGIVAGLFAIPLGLVMLRLRGIYFALGMFGLVALLTLVAARWKFTGGSTGLVVPSALQPRNIFLAMMAVAILGLMLNVFMVRSTFGLKAMAIRDDEEVAAAMGVRTLRIKVIAFALSAVLPAVAGGLVAYNRGFIDSSSMFDAAVDLQTLLFVLAGGIGTLGGPLLGAVVLEFANSQLSSSYPQYQLALFGLFIILITLFLPQGIVSLLNRVGLLRRIIIKASDVMPTMATLDERLEAHATREMSPPSAPGAEILGCQGVSVSFGGVQALTGVDFSVHEGEMVCIIGANGAGKTTLFNAISGIVPTVSGEITFDGRSVSHDSSQALARRGLGRTFQIPRLFESLTVWENILLAALGGRAADIAQDQAAWVIRILGMEEIRLHPAATLPVGHRRMVELGRALALKPKLILLDEVMAGMSDDELERVRDAIRRMPTFGVGGVTGIEHVIRAVVDLADRMIVLDQGRKIVEGPPSEILKHPEVIRAYLGEEMAL